MNPRTLVGLGAVAATALVLAVVAQRRSGETAASDGRLLLPVLSERINDVRSVSVRSADGEFTLRRGEDGWSLDSKGGYAADPAKPRELLLALRGAEIVEEKTSRPELYAELGVEDVDAPDATSALVTAEDEGGGAIASVIVGDRREVRGGSRRQEYYVRRAGEPASWLVEADLALDHRATDWLDKDLLDVARDRVRAVRIEHADGEVLYVRRPDATATDFTIFDLPEGKEPTHASAPSAVAAGLQRLTLEDVSPEDELALADPPDAVATFWTFDGLKVTVTTDESDGKLLARLRAEYTEEGPPGTGSASTEAAEPEAGAEAPEEGSADETAADDAAPAEPAGPTPEEVRAEAERLDARFTGWTYVLPTWKKSAFQKRLAELTRDVAPPPEEVPENFVELPEEVDDATALPGEAAAPGHDHDAAGSGDPEDPPPGEPPPAGTDDDGR